MILVFMKIQSVIKHFPNFVGDGENPGKIGKGVMLVLYRMRAYDQYIL